MDQTSPSDPVAGLDASGLDMSRLERSTGFMVRLAQLRIYDAFHGAMSAHGLTPTRYSLLAVLHDNPDLRPGQISEALRVKPSNMATLLAQFEAEGLIARQAGTVERRTVLVRLTPAGDALFAEIAAKVAALEDDSVAMLSPIERVLLHSLLARLVNV